jgi:RES domain-containing protein
MNRDLANAIAGTKLTAVSGTYFRHARQGIKGIKGSTGGGRWGPEHGFPVIYLGQPPVSIVAEAYRRFVDPVMDEIISASLIAPRDLLSVDVTVDQLLDLRDPRHLAAVGLDEDALRGPWPPCIRVARAAHQLGLHGILSPAATNLGVTLALFEQHLPHEQIPQITGREHWAELPADPRTPAQREAQIAARNPPNDLLP